MTNQAATDRKASHTCLHTRARHPENARRDGTYQGCYELAIACVCDRWSGCTKACSRVRQCPTAVTTRLTDVTELWSRPECVSLTRDKLVSVPRRSRQKVTLARAHFHEQPLYYSMYYAVEFRCYDSFNGPAAHMGPCAGWICTLTHGTVMRFCKMCD